MAPRKLKSAEAETPCVDLTPPGSPSLSLGLSPTTSSSSPASDVERIDARLNSLADRLYSCENSGNKARRDIEFVGNQVRYLVADRPGPELEPQSETLPGAVVPLLYGVMAIAGVAGAVIDGVGMAARAVRRA
jgi:hypothetical protein